MHSQLLLWNYSDVRSQEAASSPLSSPCVCTSCGLAFLPCLPLYVICLVSHHPEGRRSWSGSRAVSFLAQLPLNNLGLTRLTWVGAADTEALDAVCMEACWNDWPVLAPWFAELVQSLCYPSYAGVNYPTGRKRTHKRIWVWLLHCSTLQVGMPSFGSWLNPFNKCLESSVLKKSLVRVNSEWLLQGAQNTGFFQDTCVYQA